MRSRVETEVFDFQNARLPVTISVGVAEWRAGEGPWQIADATGRELDAGQSVAGLPPSPAEVAVGTPTPLLPGEQAPTPSGASPSPGVVSSEDRKSVV